jgi:RNA polymerase sigma factor (sigma-70 family)
MGDQRFGGRRSEQMSLGDFPCLATEEAASQRNDKRDRAGKGEPGLMDWDRFYTYCDEVIVIALARQPIQPADREDCRQEIWADLLASRMSLFRGGSLAAWLTTLARNKAIDTIRRARRHPVKSATAEPVGAIADPAVPCPADERVSVVRQALAELERKIEQRSYAVFFLRWFESQSFVQIAGALSLTPEQARARHHRTKAKFRQIVMKQGLRGQARG